MAEILPKGELQGYFNICPNCKKTISVNIQGNPIDHKCNILTEKDLIELGFTQHLMVGTGWNSISSMRDAVYYYKKGRITINATEFWTWFLDDDQRNDIGVSNKENLIKLLKKYNELY